jgi:hypothetical protein
MRFARFSRATLPPNTCLSLEGRAKRGVPEALIEHLSGHDVQSVRQLGLKSVKNGQLLALIERAQFDALITNHRKMEAEGQLSRRPFAILILSATNWNVIKPHVGNMKG